MKRWLGGVVLVFAAGGLGWFGLRSKESPSPESEPVHWVAELPAGRVLPPQTFHHTFYSETAGRNVGYCIYLPPNYEQGDARYPVIYNLHPHGRNEFHSLEEVALLHQQIVAKKTPEMIMVLPNGGPNLIYADAYNGSVPVETMLIKELIPFIDTAYRTVADRSGRGVEGFSMGARGATRLAMKYPDVFCSLFAQSGRMVHTAEQFDPENASAHLSGYLGPSREAYEANDVYLLLDDNLDRIKGALHIRMACGTLDAQHLGAQREFHEALLGAGVDHRYEELPGLAHDRLGMMQQLSESWFDGHVKAFGLTAHE